MNKLIIAIILWLCLTPTFGQDTIKVQTFTFDSISTRRAIFAFPDSSESFRKILMSYTLKCDAATTADQYDCGEWDYLTYTTVHHKTGEIDSILYTHDKFLAGISSFTEFPVCLTYPTYGLMQSLDTLQVIDSILAETSYTGMFPQTLPIELSMIQTNKLVKLSMLIDDNMAQSMGITPTTPLTGLKLFFNNTNLNFQELKIRATHGDAGTSSYTASDKFETYYNFPTHIQSPGWWLFPFGPQHDTLLFQFNQGGLRLEFNFRLTNGSEIPVILSAASLIGTPSIQAFSENERCLEFSGSNWIELPVNPISDSLSTEISISFWQLGGETMPQNSTLLNASNQSGNRVLNIHLPWGNSNVYWDAGLNGTSYDRINKLANTEDFKGRWNHWVFTKNALTGSMKIYLNGELWHSGTGKTFQMGGITSFNIGSSTSKSGFYTGKLDELSIWNRELTQIEIQDLMIHQPNLLSNLTGLLAYYSFDDSDETHSFSEYTSPSQNALNFGGVFQRLLSSDELRMNPQTLPFFPDLQFVQGEYESHQEIAVHIDTLWNSPVSIFEFETDQQSFVPVDTAWFYPGGIMIISNENGDSIGQIIHPIDTIIQQESIFYYGNPFDVVRNIEIGRFITPYGIGLSLGNNGFEWTYDVTDYASFLRDSVDLSAGNNQELIDLKFYMIHGIPPREVKEITEIWGSRNSYSYFDLDHNNRLAAQTIHLHPEASNFKLKTRLTGHGHNSNDGNYPHCCEWKPNEHYLLINEDTVANWYIWQDEKCAQNPVYPQGGTWPGPREGWCPGDKVNDHEFELTPYITSDSVKIDYDITDIPADNTGMGGGNYVISMQLIQYGEPSYNLDIELADILSPNKAGYYSRINPTCRDILLMLRNNGTDTLYTASIECSVSGGIPFFYTWNGALPPHESQIVAISIPDETFWNGDGQNLFTASVDLLNVPPQEYSENNSMTVAFNMPDVFTQDFLIVYKSNNLPSENWYEITDSQGNIVHSRYTADPATYYYDTLDLPNGCYTLTLVDSGLDGLSYWAYPEQGAGLFRLKKVGGANLKVFEPEFGHKITYSFTVSKLIHTIEASHEQSIELFPNPANNEFKVALNGYQGEVQAILCDITQRVLLRRNWNTEGYSEHDFQVSELPAGMYYLHIKTSIGYEIKTVLVE